MIVVPETLYALNYWGSGDKYIWKCFLIALEAFYYLI